MSSKLAVSNLRSKSLLPPNDSTKELQVSRTKSVSKYLMAIFMVGAGTMHFVKPDFYMKIMPPYLPLHLELVYPSGVFEIALGLLLLVPRFSRFAAWGIIALLIAIFPANIYVYRHQELVPAAPLVHLLRLPLQAVFILWAFWHTRPRCIHEEGLDMPALGSDYSSGPGTATNALLSGQSPAAASSRRYRASNSLDRWANIRLTSRRLPLTRGIVMPS